MSLLAAVAALMMSQGGGARDGGIDAPVAMRLAAIERAIAGGEGAFEERLERIACERPELCLPELPSLPLTRSDMPAARFHPRIAGLVFDEYIELSRVLSPGAMAPAREAYAGYARALARVWCGQISPAVSGAFWPEYRRAMSACRPSVANRDLRTILACADAALASIPAELSPDEVVLPERAAIERDRAALELAWFDEACRRARDKWAGLSADPGQARADLLRLTCERFQADYLEIYSESPLARGSARYWSGLVLGAMTSIAATSPARADAAALIRESRAFPVVLGAAEVLQPAAVEALRERAGALIRTGVATAAPDEGGPLSRGRRTDFPRINDQIARLAGEDAFDDESRDRWAYRLRAVLGFIASGQSCELVILGPDQQTAVEGASPGAVALQNFDLILGGAEAGPFFTDRPWDTGIQIQTPGPALRVRFRETPGGVAAAELELPGPWNVLTLLRHPEARIDEAADPSGRLVKAPLVFTDVRGRRLYYWVGLRFQRPPPALTEWPSDEDWPR